MPIRAALTLLLLAALSSGAAAQSDSVLEWRFAPGDRFEIVREVRSRTETTTALGEEKPVVSSEEEEAKTTFDAVAEEPSAEGCSRLVLTLREFSLRHGSEETVLSISAFRDPRGAPRVRLRAGGESRLDEEEKSLLKTIASRLLSGRIELEIDPAGIVRDATYSGARFDHLGIGGSESKVVMAMLRAAHPEGDFAALAASSLFTHLPGSTVKTGAQWPAKRELRLAGLSLSGEGTARLLPAEAGLRFRIEETSKLRVDTAALRAKVKRLLDAMFKEMGQSANVGVEVPEGEPVPARVVTDFKADGTVTTTWDELTIPATGRLLLLTPGEKGSAKVSTRTKASIRTVMKKR